MVIIKQLEIMSVTFKTHKPTGRFRSFDTEYADIKFKKKIFGTISEISGLGDKYKINLMVVSEKGGFDWISLKVRFKAMNEAKLFVKENYEAISKKFNLFYQDNE